MNATMNVIIKTRKFGVEDVLCAWWSIHKSGFLKILVVILVVSIPVDVILQRIPVNFPAGTYGVQSAQRYQNIYRMLEARGTNPPSSGQLQGNSLEAQAASQSLSPAASLNLTATAYGWSKTWGGQGVDDVAQTVAVDKSNNAYVGGRFGCTNCDLNPGETEDATTACQLVHPRGGSFERKT